jgi:hypothetical protein
VIAAHPNLFLSIFILVAATAHVGTWRYSPLRYRSGEYGKLGKFVVADHLDVRTVRLFMLSYAAKWTAVGMVIGRLLI